MRAFVYVWGSEGSYRYKQYIAKYNTMILLRRISYIVSKIQRQ